MRRLLFPILLFVSITAFSRSDTVPPDTIQPDTVCRLPDSMPEYPGGMSRMLSYIMKNINYPIDQDEVQGSVYISFIVETDGSITDVKVIRGIPGGTAFDKEAIRVVKTFPRWKPGIQNGKPVRVRYNLPIKFHH